MFPWLPLNNPICPTGAVVRGIDVSVYQGTIDWAKVKASGVEYAFIRVANGVTLDTKFTANWTNARAAGVLRGAYQYWHPDRDPVAQADFLLDNMGPLEENDLPPVIDVEAEDGQTPEVIAANVRKWADRIQDATGRRPIVYTGLYFWKDEVGGSTVAADLPLWVAQYGPACPTLPKPWTEWTFFQHSSTGTVPGITGNVDLDKFNGDRAALDAFIAERIDAPPPDAGVPPTADAALPVPADAASPPTGIDEVNGGCQVGRMAGGMAGGSTRGAAPWWWLLAVGLVLATSRTAGRRSGPSSTSAAGRSTRAARRRPSSASR